MSTVLLDQEEPAGWFVFSEDILMPDIKEKYKLLKETIFQIKARILQYFLRARNETWEHFNIFDYFIDSIIWLVFF